MDSKQFENEGFCTESEEDTTAQEPQSKNQDIKIGSRVIGNWGAMLSLSYGIITEIKNERATINWDDGINTIEELSDFNFDYLNSSEIGLYIDNREIQHNTITEIPTEEDIFSKFDDVKIENNNRISPEDEEFCKSEQEEYNGAVKILYKIFDVINNDLGIDFLKEGIFSENSKNGYLSSYDFKDLTEVLHRKKDNFIHRIIEHFVKKYNITIDSYKLVRKYEKMEVDYNILLEEIFIELGGFNFREKAENEIKEALIKKIKWENWRTKQTEYKMEVKNNKIIFNDIIYVSKDWYKNSEFQRDSITPLLKAISLFDNNTLTIHQELEKFTSEYRCTEWAFDTHQLNFNKINTMKIFKNGKIEITFKTSEQAKKFSIDFCGYNPELQKSA